MNRGGEVGCIVETTRRHGRLFGLSPLCLLLAGCGFQPDAWRPEKNGFGYQTGFLDGGLPNEGYASFHGSQGIDDARLDAYCHRAAAQACRDAGFPYFAVLEAIAQQGQGREEQTTYMGSYEGRHLGEKAKVHKYRTWNKHHVTKGRRLRFIALAEVPEPCSRAVLSVARLLEGASPAESVARHPPLGEAAARPAGSDPD